MLAMPWYERTGLGNEPIGWRPRPLTQSELARLWLIATAIYTTWELFRAGRADPFAEDVSHLRSTWTEHVQLRAQPTAASGLASYVGEYENALNILAELLPEDSTDNPAPALQKLLFARPRSGAGGAAMLDTPLLHAKHYVVDEFITVLIVGGGFRQFGGWNYNGFLGGSRFDQVTAIAQPIDQLNLGAAG